MINNLVLVVFSCMILCGCGAVRKVATRQITGSLFDSSQANVFSQDEDPELIRDAFPFTLKMLESLLSADPENRNLLLATSSAFSQYANAFVAQDAERMVEQDFAEAQRLRQRASKLYLRGRDYALASLELDYSGFTDRILVQTDKALSILSQEDVPRLFWVGAGWAGALSVDINNMALVAELRIVEAIMRRALLLDESYDSGALHEFFISFEGRRSEAMGGSIVRARKHFERAIELTDGVKASPYVALATSVAIQLQDHTMFSELLNQALHIDVEQAPDWKLVNVLSQEPSTLVISSSL